MRAIVLKTFRDKETGTLHKKGTEIDVTKERLGEINSTSYGKLVEELKEKKKK